MIRENILIAKFKKEVNIMRKTFSLILSVIMVLSLFTVGAFAAEGTAINSTEDFKNMTADGKYYLAADITVDATYAGEFTGTLDGNGKTVTVSVPMFEKVKGTVKNLNVKGAINADSNAGAVAISAEGATFEAIKNAASVTAAGHAAGIVALAENAGITIKNCSNSGAITTTGTKSDDSVSGIVAYSKDAPDTVITGCSNSGKITVDSTATKGNNQSAAGISGRANAKSVGITVKNCSNSGEIYGYHQTGGVIGYHTSSSTVEGCYNTGKVESKYSYAGGVVGRFCGDKTTDDTFIVKNCANYGSVKGAVGQSGGIVGYSAHSLQGEYCFNYGDIDSAANTAGVFGSIGNSKAYGNGGIVSTVKYCGNEGKVTSRTGYAGGVVGYTYGSGTAAVETNKHVEIYYCYNVGEVVAATAGKIASGILGYVNSSAVKIQNCFSGGKVTAGEGIKSYAIYWNNACKADEGNIKDNMILEGCADFASQESPDGTKIAEDYTKAGNTAIENAVPAAIAATGELTYKLNQAFGSDVFRQTLGTDKMPTTKTSSKLVKLVDGKYVNDESEPTPPAPVPTGDTAVYVAIAAVAAVVILGTALVSKKRRIAE